MAIGDLSASGVLYTDRRRFYLNENEVSELYMSETPFLSGLMGMGSEQVDDPDYKMFEYRAGWANPKFVATGTATTGVPGTQFAVNCGGAEGVSIDSSLIGAVVDIWDTTEATFRGTAVVVNVSGVSVTFKALGLATSATQTLGNIVENIVCVRVSCSH